MDNNTFLRAFAKWSYYFHPPDYLASSAIAITGAGCVCQQHSSRVVNRRYPDNTLVLSLSGGATLELGDKSWELKEGDCFYIPQMEKHSYGAKFASLWASYWLSFKSSESIGDIWKELLPTVKNLSTRRLHLLFEQIDTNARRNAAAEEYSAILFNIMALLRSPQSIAASKSEKAVEDAADYIQVNLSKSIKLDDVAEAAGYSATHFARLFKKRFGMPVNEYITGARLGKAQLLLAKTKMSVKEISRQIGFNDQLYFSRVFKQKLKITPTRFREYYQ